MFPVVVGHRCKRFHPGGHPTRTRPFEAACDSRSEHRVQAGVRIVGLRSAMEVAPARPTGPLIDRAPAPTESSCASSNTRNRPSLGSAPNPPRTLQTAAIRLRFRRPAGTPGWLPAPTAIRARRRQEERGAPPDAP